MIAKEGRDAPTGVRFPRPSEDLGHFRCALHVTAGICVRKTHSPFTTGLLVSKCPRDYSLPHVCQQRALVLQPVHVGEMDFWRAISW